MTGRSAAAVAATTDPGMDTLGFLTGLDPTSLCPSDLVDAVITTERLLARVHALQIRLLAELGRPHRCGDVTALVDALIEHAGPGHRGNDTADADADTRQELTRDRSIGVAAAELAAVLDWAPTTAKIRITQATRIRTALPATYTALHTGRVDIGRPPGAASWATWTPSTTPTPTPAAPPPWPT